MIPHERSLVKRFENDPFSIIGVNSDGREAYDEEVESMGVTWRSFMEGSTRGPIPTKWNVQGWPTIYVIDAEGIIRYKNVREQPLEDAIEELVNEANGDA